MAIDDKSQQELTGPDGENRVQDLQSKSVDEREAQQVKGGASMRDIPIIKTVDKGTP